MKNFKQVLEEIENNKNKLINLNTIDEKEIEKGYNLFYDNMIKCYGYCNMSYYEFKKCICCYTINKYNETLKNVKNSQKS